MSEAANELLFIRKYLLGGLKGEEREQLEERVLSDAEFRNRILIVEENLIEDYAAGMLEEAERQEFQKMFYANPQRRIEVQVVAGLKQHAATKWWTRSLRAVRDKLAFLNSRKRAGSTLAPADASSRAASTAFPTSFDSLSGLRKAAIAIALFVVVAITFLLVQRFLRPEQTPGSLTQDQQRHDLIERELARLNKPQSLEDQPLPAAVAATLGPGLSRGDETQHLVEFPTVTLVRGVESVPLRLLLRPAAQEYRSFEVVLTRIGTAESYKVNLEPFELTDRARALVLTLPARLLGDGDYQVLLSGRAADGRTEMLPDHYYYFRLVRQ